MYLSSLTPVISFCVINSYFFLGFHFEINAEVQKGTEGLQIISILSFS